MTGPLKFGKEGEEEAAREDAGWRRSFETAKRLGLLSPAEIAAGRIFPKGTAAKVGAAFRLPGLDPVPTSKRADSAIGALKNAGARIAEAIGYLESTSHREAFDAAWDAASREATVAELREVRSRIGAAIEKLKS